MQEKHPGYTSRSEICLMSGGGTEQQQPEQPLVSILLIHRNCKNLKFDYFRYIAKNENYDYTERTNERTIRVIRDQQKACDRVIRNFVLNILVAVDFGPDFFSLDSYPLKRRTE